MSFSSVDNKIQYATDGIVFKFPFPYPFQATSDLVVLLRSTDAGSEPTTLVEGVDYNVTTVGDAGRYTSGQIVTTSVLASGSTITILRIVDNDQETANYNPGGDFDEQSTEDAFDKSAMQSQQNYNGAVILKKSGDVAGPIELPDLADNAGKLLQISSDGKSITASDSASSSDARVNSLFNGPAADDIFVTFLTVGNGATITAGTGSPEGSIVAITGSIYLRVFGGADTSIYFKESGGGDTGWVARGVLAAPTIASFVNAPHDHGDAAGGGGLTVDSIAEKTAANGVSIDGFGIKDNAPNPTSWPCFATYLNANQAIASTDPTKVEFDTEVFDTNSDFAANKFTPTVAGKYSIYGKVSVNQLDAGSLLCYIYKNGASYTQVESVAGAASKTVHMFAIIDMNGSTDYLEIFVDSGTDAAYNVLGGSTASVFEGSRIA